MTRGSLHGNTVSLGNAVIPTVGDHVSRDAVPNQNSNTSIFGTNVQGVRSNNRESQVVRNNHTGFNNNRSNTPSINQTTKHYNNPAHNNRNRINANNSRMRINTNNFRQVTQSGTDRNLHVGLESLLVRFNNNERKKLQVFEKIIETNRDKFYAAFKETTDYALLRKISIQCALP